jgi:glycosyltransferase involved in cell wall biosynthesis
MGLTIIIPVHNGAPYLRKCIQAITKLNYPHEKLDVIVVDNLSNDENLPQSKLKTNRNTRKKV